MCAAHYSEALLIKVSVTSAGCAIRYGQGEKQGGNRQMRMDDILVFGQGRECSCISVFMCVCVCGCVQCLKRGIDSSTAVKSHCMSLSDKEHYSQSLWINLNSAPHHFSDLYQTNDPVHKRGMIGKRGGRSVLTATRVTQVPRDLPFKERDAYK